MKEMSTVSNATGGSLDQRVLVSVEALDVSPWIRVKSSVTLSPLATSPSTHTMEQLKDGSDLQDPSNTRDLYSGSGPQEILPTNFRRQGIFFFFLSIFS